MEKSNAISIITSRKSISQAGAYELRATNVSEYDGKFIANLNGMTPYHVTEAKRLIMLGDEESIQKAVNQGLSASLRPTDYIPSKGEIVKVVVDNVTTSNGITGLFVVSVSELKARNAGKVSLNFDDLEIEGEDDFNASAAQPKLVASKPTLAK